MQKEYFVLERQKKWWVIMDGALQGPYVSSLVAEAAAISLAKLDFKAGLSARVTMDHRGSHLVYDSTAAEAE